MLNKLQGVGLVSTGFSPRMLYISDATYSQQILGDSTWANRVIYISSDKNDLSGVLSVLLFDPTTVPNGTLVTIFNSPGGPAGKDLNVNWSSDKKISGVAYTIPSQCNATGLTWTVNVTLGRGSGVTFINQSRFGNRLANTVAHGFSPNQQNCQMGSDSVIPDVLPVALDPVDWAVWKYYGIPNLNLCTSFNNLGITGTTKYYYNKGAQTNPNNALTTIEQNCVIDAGGGYFGNNYYSGGDYNTQSLPCNSLSCACFNNGGSLWCNTTL